jgi:hypothetical protein
VRGGLGTRATGPLVRRTRGITGSAGHRLLVRGTKGITWVRGPLARLVRNVY